MLVIRQMGPIDFHGICFHTMEVMGYINCLCPHSSKYLLHLIQNELLQKTFNQQFETVFTFMLSNYN